jgi:hypothetical protein
MAGRISDISVAIMEITTSSSMRVKPVRVFRNTDVKPRDCIRVLQKQIIEAKCAAGDLMDA